MQSMTIVLLLVAAIAASASASPFRGKVGPGTGGNPLNQNNQGHGSVQGGIHRDKGIGTSVHVAGHGDVWRSQDGTARVHAGGNYGQVVHGPAKGFKQGNAAINFEKKF